MSQTVYLLTWCLPLATILLVFAMRSYAGVQTAKAKLAHDGAYRQLAERSAADGVQIAAALAAMQSMQADATARLASIEKILSAVG